MTQNNGNFSKYLIRVKHVETSFYTEIQVTALCIKNTVNSHGSRFLPEIPSSKTKAGDPANVDRAEWMTSTKSDGAFNTYIYNIIGLLGSLY